MSFFDRMAESNDRKFFGGQVSRSNEHNNGERKRESLLTCLDGKPDWAAGGGSGGDDGSDTNLVSAFDAHAIIYIFFICLVGCAVFGHKGITVGDIIGCAFCFCIFGSMIYYTIKGFIITCGTYTTFKQQNPGKSIWDLDEGVTSYDQNMANAIGRACAQHQRPSYSGDGLTNYDKAMAREIARNMRNK